MFVLKHKTKELYIYKGNHEVDMRSIDYCTTYISERAAQISLNSHKTQFYLNDCGENISKFEVREVTLTLKQ